jgi:hypothetical protein
MPNTLSPVQVADVGQWMHRHRTMMNVDKELDSKPEENHRFLAQRDKLLEKKKANPKCRITLSNNDIMEKITVQEETVTGMEGPRVKWMELSKYEKRFGKADPNKLRSHMINGKMVSGVDYIEAEEPRINQHHRIIDRSSDSCMRMSTARKYSESLSYSLLQS